jgi:hypothetical protein
LLSALVGSCETVLTKKSASVRTVTGHDSRSKWICTAASVDAVQIQLQQASTADLPHQLDHIHVARRALLWVLETVKTLQIVLACRAVIMSPRHRSGTAIGEICIGTISVLEAFGHVDRAGRSRAHLPCALRGVWAHRLSELPRASTPRTCAVGGCCSPCFLLLVLPPPPPLSLSPTSLPTSIVFADWSVPRRSPRLRPCCLPGQQVT